MMVEADENSLIKVSVEAYNSDRQISILKYIHDIVQYQDIQTYILTLPSYFFGLAGVNMSLSIDLIPFYGNPELFVHYNTNLANKQDLNLYAWHDTQFDDEDDPSTSRDGLASLTISHKEVMDKVQANQ